MPFATPRRPSLADVARLAGVSTATVSRVLNDPSLVRAETRHHVQRAVASLGYTPHFGGRALASNRTDTIGAIIPTMDNAIFARGLQALQEELADAGVTLLVSTSNYSAEQEEQQIQTLLSRNVDGLVLIGEARKPEIYEQLRIRSVPFVLVWTWREDCPWTCVGFDNVAAARQVAERVLDLGHRRIAMVAGITAGNDRAEARVQGVREALATRGMELDPSQLIEAEYHFDAGSGAARAFLERRDRPTAIICGNDVLAAGVVMGAQKMGFRVPQEVSVTGFDDIDIATLLNPPLTTVHVPHRRMGRIAAQTLLSMRSSNENELSTCFKTDFIQRESLGVPL
ncbi:MAG: LacI family DNA-binding transcriptional regulator [Pseudomonadota bacterium]